MNVDFASLLQQYGYLALFIGTVLEGESVLVLAGFAAYQGYLQLPLVIFCAAAGGFLGDEIFFAIGRLFGRRLVRRYKALASKIDKVDDLICRYPSGLIIGVRFLYGLRIAGPIAIGMTSISWLRFATLNLVGAALWASIVAGIGYVFGDVIKTMFGNVHEASIIGLLLFIAVATHLWKKARRA
ncbi:MAG TPA: DedA family protein [Burkholderiaceae bacterium]|nr:DedA family protein [Burkholderiaceae bacterium]